MVKWSRLALGAGMVAMAAAVTLPASAAATFPGRNGMVIALFNTATRATVEGIEPSGGGRAVYTCTEDGDSCDFQIENPSVSPDGRELAFDGMIYTDSYFTQSEVTLLELGGRSLRFVPFSSSAYSQMETAPSWIPGGKTFVFAEGYEDGGPAPSCNTETTGGRHDTKLVEGSCSHPAVAPDGRSFLYDHASGVWRAGIDGADPALLIAGASRPSWAPNGKRIAFVRGGAVWAASSTGRDRHRLVRRGSDPVWSPNGKLIAYALVDHGGELTRIYATAADGKGAARLLFTEPKKSGNEFSGMDWQALGAGK